MQNLMVEGYQTHDKGDRGAIIPYLDKTANNDRELGLRNERDTVKNMRSECNIKVECI